MTNKKHYFIVGIILLFLSIPVLGTILYSFSSSWGATVLPDGLSLKWYNQLFSDTRFILSLQRSLLLAVVSLVISFIVIIPSIVISAYYFPKVLKVIELLSLLPFMVPAVVLAVGLLKVYSGLNITIFGIPIIILGAYFSVAFPFIYRGVKNGLDSLHLQSLVETVNILGGTNLDAFRFVILPNLKKGITSSGILSLAILLGPVQNSLFPKMMELYRKDYKEYYQFYLFSNTLVTQFYFIITLVSIFVVKYTFGYVYAQEYSPAIGVYAILAVSIFIKANGSLQTGHMTLKNITKKSFYKTLISLILNIILNALLIPRYGIDGAAIATLITQFTALFLIDFFIAEYREQAWIQLKSFNTFYLLKEIMKKYRSRKENQNV